MKKMLLVLLSLLLIVSLGYSQEKEDESGGEIADMMEMSFDDVLNMDVYVASGTKAKTSRLSPGIVTVVTREEILNSGARDLIDVLQLIPGFNFGVDVMGVVGVGMRGMWAHEGKVLLLIDGQEMNEDLFSNLEFGHHYSVNLIDKIEIIRGPGSAIYGGYAELGVINIITKTPKLEKEGFVSGTLSTLEDASGRKEANLFFGKKTDKLTFSSSAYLAEGSRSDEVFTDFYGGSYDMGDDSKIETANFNTGLQVNNLSFRYIYDRYRLFTRDIYYQIAPDEAVENVFDSHLAELKYQFQLSDKLTITPKFKYKWNLPWSATSSEARALAEMDPGAYGAIYIKQTTEKYTGDISFDYDINENNSISSGVEYYTLQAKDKIDQGFDGKDDFDYQNISVYAQALFETSLADITIGGRYSDSSEFESSFVPRFALTKQINDFHCKLLLSKAFRSPGVKNVTSFASLDGTSGEIKPENTTIYEVETGYRAGEFMFTVNFFDIKISDPIVYYYIDEDAYDNYNKTGTRGVEFVTKFFRENFGYADLSYSFYEVNKNEVPQYEVPGEDDVLLGFPSHKVTLSGSFKLLEDIRISPSVIYLSKRWGASGVTEEDDLIITDFDPVTLVNLTLIVKNVLTKGLDVSLSGYNITNEEFSVLQPYNGYHAPLPMESTEYLLKVSKQF